MRMGQIEDLLYKVDTYKEIHAKHVMLLLG